MHACTHIACEIDRERKTERNRKQVFRFLPLICISVLVAILIGRCDRAHTHMTHSDHCLLAMRSLWPICVNNINAIQYNALWMREHKFIVPDCLMWLRTSVCSVLCWVPYAVCPCIIGPISHYWIYNWPLCDFPLYRTLWPARRLLPFIVKCSKRAHVRRAGDAVFAKRLIVQCDRIR